MTATLQNSPYLDIELRSKEQVFRDQAKRMAGQNHLSVLHYTQLDEPGRLRDLATSVEIIHARLWDTEDRLELPESREALDRIATAMEHLDEAMGALRAAADAAE